MRAAPSSRKTRKVQLRDDPDLRRYADAVPARRGAEGTLGRFAALSYVPISRHSRRELGHSLAEVFDEMARRAPRLERVWVEGQGARAAAA